MKHKTKSIAFLLILLCSCKISWGQSHNNYVGKPIYDILVKRNHIVLGHVQVELYPTLAPEHVRNFDSLVSLHFFDSTAFHRVIPGFMIQGGDPNSKHGPKSSWGNGDPLQYNIQAEFSAAKHLRGTLSAARDNDINSANSQFFICVAPASWLDGNYSIYGHALSGMDIVDTIVMSPRDANDNPLQKIEMFVTYAGYNDSIPTTPLLNIPADGTTGVAINKQLKWFAVSGALTYTLEVSVDSTFMTLYKKTETAGLTDVVTGLSKGTTYFWRVKTNNGGHYSNYSEVRHFMTAGSLGVSTSKEENRVHLQANASEGSFLFSNLRKDEYIEIYNTQGKCIQKALEENNTVHIDLKGNSAGIYVYKVLSHQNTIETGKIMLTH